MAQIDSAGSFVEFSSLDCHGTVFDHFERVARKYDNRIAVRGAKGACTYGELNRRANRIAHQLVAKRGPKPEPIVVLMEPECALFAAILGILKSGKFYVPLDPWHPIGRNENILSNCQATLILTDGVGLSLAESLAGHGIEVINAGASSLSDENLGIAVPDDALAYLIYTSGSTGTPKGVSHNHRNILHKVKEYTDSWRILHGDRIALIYSPSTSGAVRDIFGALLNGATLYPFKIKLEGVAPLGKWLVENQITIYNSAATVFRQFVTGLSGHPQFNHLRLIHVGSEPIYKADVESYQKRFSEECIFVARYGTSEISPIRQFVVNKKTELASDVVPAGYKVAGAEVLLINEAGVEVEAGQVGEIAVRSSYITPGYWGDSQTTCSAFISGPGGEHDRLYRTGDLGLLRSDGCLLYLGRKDFQVKVSGHRVELAEIEVALLKLPGVKEAVVIADDGFGDSRLIAYVVLSTQASPDISDLRLALMKILPDHMIPVSIECLDALPLTATGKVDRKALPAVAHGRPALAKPIVSPSTKTQIALAKIWAEVLKIQDVGINDQFLLLGGNSLAAMQIIAKVTEVFQIECPLQSFLHSSSIAEMAELIETFCWASSAGLRNEQRADIEEGEI